MDWGDGKGASTVQAGLVVALISSGLRILSAKGFDWWLFIVGLRDLESMLVANLMNVSRSDEGS